MSLKTLLHFFDNFENNKTVEVLNTDDCNMVVAPKSPTSTKRKQVGFTYFTSQKSMLEKYSPWSPGKPELISFTLQFLEGSNKQMLISHLWKGPSYPKFAMLSYANHLLAPSVLLVSIFQSDLTIMRMSNSRMYWFGFGGQGLKVNFT